MTRNAILTGPTQRNITIALVQIIALCLLVIPLPGCGADGQGGPVVSSLSSPNDTPSSEDTSSGSPSSTTADAADSGEETSTDLAASVDEEFEPATPAELTEGEDDPTVSVTSTPTGATAQLTWDADPDPTVTNYYVYYGKQSSGEQGSCSYDASQPVETPPATITGLEPNTLYFFAISALGESESPCSNEILVVTPPVQS